MFEVVGRQDYPWHEFHTLEPKSPRNPYIIKDSYAFLHGAYKSNPDTTSHNSFCSFVIFPNTLAKFIFSL